MFSPIKPTPSLVIVFRFFPTVFEKSKWQTFPRILQALKNLALNFQVFSLNSPIQLILY